MGSTKRTLAIGLLTTMAIAVASATADAKGRAALEWTVEAATR